MFLRFQTVNLSQRAKVKFGGFGVIPSISNHLPFFLPFLLLCGVFVCEFSFFITGCLLPCIEFAVWFTMTFLPNSIQEPQRIALNIALKCVVFSLI